MTFRHAFAALGAATAMTIATAASVGAAPLGAGPAHVRTAVESNVTNVQYRGRAFDHRDRHYYRRGAGPGFVAGAIVGAATAPLWAFGGSPYGYGPEPYYGPSGSVAPVVRTPNAPFYAYNRYSGQIHGSCVIDDGYGRTKPCSAGGGS